MGDKKSGEHKKIVERTIFYFLEGRRSYGRYSTVGPRKDEYNDSKVFYELLYGEIILLDDIRRNFANEHIEKAFLPKTTSQIQENL